MNGRFSGDYLSAWLGTYFRSRLPRVLSRAESGGRYLGTLRANINPSMHIYLQHSVAQSGLQEARGAA